ncbi:hypothetical protein MBLNU230_g4337t1 [Neophaeotheca triangularis]
MEGGDDPCFAPRAGTTFNASFQPDPTPSVEYDTTTAAHSTNDTLVDDDSDGSADMDLSLDTSPTPPPPGPRQAQVPWPSTAGAKRKLSDDAAVNGGSTADATKRPRLATRFVPPPPVDDGIPYLKKLSPECWQEVFSYLPPAMLARGLRVSRVLNAFLSQLEPSPKVSKSTDSRTVRIRDSESLWGDARKAFFPQLPKPLKQCTERTMIRLIGGRHCEICDKPSQSAPQVPITQYTAGPGADGVRVVFAYGLRACGPCLAQITTKDIELFQSKYKSLLPGLPFAFLTPEFHLITNTIRKQHNIPGNLRAGKVYFQQDVESLYLEFEEAQSLGAGAVEEWQKGLRGMGDALLADAGRWEKWEATLPLGADLASVLREYDSTPPLHAPEVAGRSATANGTLLDAVQEAPTYSQAAPGLPGSTASYYPPSQQQQSFPKQARSTEEAQWARQARKADLEQRCMQLEPPIAPHVLQHMEVFQNAMQIVQPVNEAQWEVLKPKFEAQREAAELIEHQRAMQYAALEAASRVQQDHARVSKPAREEYGHKYEQSQETLRRKLCEYADDVVNGQWGAGRGLNKESCPIFAVDVLQHVKQKYDLDYEAAKSRGERPFRHPKAKNHEPDPFLSLENMKYVHDKKVRPLTEPYVYDLFVCAGCQAEDSSMPPQKWYALESLIQHYGAKHADGEFSKDNIVVHWQTAEWPADPPFDPEPSRFLKAERPPVDRRYNGRSRNNQHQHGQHQGQRGARHDYASAPPASGLMLSETPFFRSEGSVNAGDGDVAASLDTLSRIANEAPNGQKKKEEQDKVSAAHEQVIANEARRIWDLLDSVQGLPVPIRVQTAIHHAAKQFHATFHQTLRFGAFTDVSITSDSMKPIRVAQGLVCRCCLDNTQGKRDEPYYSRIKDEKLWSFERLCVHFDIMHIQSAMNREALTTNWVSQLIEQPDDQQVHDLIKAKGMDDTKLGLIADAYHSVFPYPLPSLTELIRISQSQSQSAGPTLADRLLKRMQKPKDQHKSKKKEEHQKRRDGRDESEPLPSAAEDEYDPRRPVLAEKEKEFDPAKFDTDLSKPAPSSSAPQDPNALPYSLNSETMKALADLLGPQAQPQAQQPAPVNSWNGNYQTDRASAAAPSHPEPLHAPFQAPTPRAPPPASVTPLGATTTPPVDISAILKSLQGGQPQAAGQGMPVAAPGPLPASQAPGAAQYRENYERPMSRMHEYTPHDHRFAQQPPLQAYARDSPAPQVYDQHRSSSRYESRAPPQYQPAYSASTRYEPPSQSQGYQPSHGSYNPEQPQQPAYGEQARNYASATPSYQQLYQPPPQQYGQDLSAALTRNAHAYDNNTGTQAYAPRPAPPTGYREASTAYQPQPQHGAPAPPQGYRPASPASQQPPQYAGGHPPAAAPGQYAPPREYAPPPTRQYIDQYGRILQMVVVDEPSHQGYNQRPSMGHGEGHYQR